MVAITDKSHVTIERTLYVMIVFLECSSRLAKGLTRWNC